jgi:hypothetical protein
MAGKVKTQNAKGKTGLNVRRFAFCVSTFAFATEVP